MERKNEPLGWLAKMYGRNTAENFAEREQVTTTPVREGRTPSMVRHGGQQWLTGLYGKSRSQASGK